MRDPAGSAMPNEPITRREALRRTTLGAFVIATGGCLGSTEPSGAGGGDGRLTARVTSPSQTTAPGLYPLGLAGSRDGFLYVPTSYRSDTPAPIALLLHGAGHDATEMVDPIRPLADTLGLVLLAPDSRGGTWDAIRGSFSDDVQFIDRAFTHAFARVRVDANRVRIVGFSDGGSYSLSLGMINGDLFSRVVAFSPGFIVPRLQALIMNEAARMVEEGAATAEEIDKATRLGLGLRFAALGVIEFIDYGGNDILYHASNYLSAKVSPERYAAPEIVKRLMREDRNGLKSGEGFYDYRGRDLKEYRKDVLARTLGMLRHAGLQKPPR